MPSERARTALSILAAGMWINGCEFVRNQLILKELWVEHYAAMGLIFPSETRNAVGWALWGFIFATFICILSRRFSVAGTTVLAWVSGFLLMWIVTWNLAVLPAGLLPVAIPFSLFEALGAALICSWMERVSK